MNCRFSRALRVWCVRVYVCVHVLARSDGRDSREGIIYRVKGERAHSRARARALARGEKCLLARSLAPSAMYYLVPGTMGFVCKSFETRNQAERPPTSRAGCSGSLKGPVGCRGAQRRAHEEGSKFAPRCISFGRGGGTSLKSERAKGSARKCACCNQTHREKERE